jgi:hypothetical protein
VKSGLVVSKLAIVLDQAEGDPIMAIGGLRSSFGMKQSVVKATRQLNGLRPKDVLLLAAAHSRRRPASRRFTRSQTSGMSNEAVESCIPILMRIGWSAERGGVDGTALFFRLKFRPSRAPLGAIL